MIKKVFKIMMELKPNKDKNLLITVDGKSYARIPIKTHVITKTDKMGDVIKKYATSFFMSGDFLCISERTVAITQGRSIPMKEIKPGTLAKFLVKFVHKSKYGIGLGIPETMQVAIDEVGALRILFSAFVAGITKPFGIKGMFYHVAGRAVASIDGPCDYTLPPYNEYVTLGPKNAKKVSKELEEMIGYPVVIIDANDLGVDVLGISDPSINKKFVEKLFKDNPLGQSDEQTPLCVVRMMNGEL